MTEEHVEVRTLDEEHLHSHGRVAGRGKRIKKGGHYAKQYSVPTQEPTQKVFDIFGSREFAQELKKKVPRHYREQCRRLIALKGRFDAQILQRQAG